MKEDHILLEFKKLKLDDAAIVRPYFLAFGSQLCDYTVGGTIMWRDYFGTEYAMEDGVLYFRITEQGNAVYSFPVAETAQACRQGLLRLAELCRTQGVPLIINKVPAEYMPMVLALFPDAACSSDPDWYDYVYDTQEFTQLRGRKYSGQRNHINHFMRSWADWRTETIGPENLGAVSEFFDRYVQSRDKIYDSFYAEEEKVREVLDNYAAYGFMGTALWAGGRVVAFSMGEIQGDMLFVHIEKADRDCSGAYQMISHSFANQWGTVRYLNREEDVGDEGLRISKQSYHPVKMLEKFTVQVRP